MKRGLGRHMYRNAGTFNPATLFASGQKGVWYDPSNFSTLFQDSAGTTPVTAVEQPVGLMLDQSQGLALGAELFSTFTTVTSPWVQIGSSWSIDGTQIANKDLIIDPWSLTVGKTYKFSFTVSGASSGLIIYAAEASPRVFGNGTYVLYINASANYFYVRASSGVSATISNISVKALPGNHASQSTSANRPTLSARYNLLTYSQQYDNAAWTKSNSFVQTNLALYSQDFSNAAWLKQFVTAVSNTAVAPDGTTTASLIYPTTTGTLREVYQTVATATEVRTHSVYVKSAGFTWVYLGSNDPLPAGVFFNLSGNGAVGTKATNWNGTITPVGNGWFRITATSPSVLQSYLVVATVDGDNTTTATANGTSGLYLWGAQLVQGSVPGDYRATTSAALPVLYADPIGGVTAEKLCETTAAAAHYAQYTVNTFTGVPLTWSCIAKAAERQYLCISESNSTSWRACFDLVNGTVAGSAGTPLATITSLGNGWYRCAISVTTTLATFLASVAVSNTATPTSPGPSYTGDGSSGIYVWGSDLRPANDGVGLPPYQRINAATDYDTAGFPPYLLANGSTTSLATASIDFSATDKMTVWAGVRKLSDAAAGAFAGLGNVGSQAGSFELDGPNGAALTTYMTQLRGASSLAGWTYSTYTAPVSNVLSVSMDLSDTTGSGANKVTARINAVTNNGTWSTADAGTGNFGNYPLYIAARTSTGLFFNGRIYSLIVRGAATDATTLAQTENYVNSKTLAY